MSKQRCLLVNIYLSWLFLAAGLVFLLWRGHLAIALAWLLCLPLVQWLYVRQFPRLSPLMGYGSVADSPAAAVAAAPAKVTFYTALGCPFCPLVEQRLEALRKKTGFELEKIDVTLRPDLLAAKGIRSVPVVEIGEQRLLGLATSEQLAAALGAQSQPRMNAH